MFEVLNIQDIGSSCPLWPGTFFCSFTPPQPHHHHIQQDTQRQSLLLSLAAPGIILGTSRVRGWIFILRRGVVLQMVGDRALRQEVRRAPGLVMGSQGSHGLRLLGINPPYLTRAQLCLPGPPTDCNQSNCDLYMPATRNTSYGTHTSRKGFSTTSCNCRTSSTLANAM